MESKKRTATPKSVHPFRGEGGIVASNTYNLTRITTVSVGVAAVLTAISDAGMDVTGFTPGQRLVLVVAAIAAVAVVSCADIMGRAIVTGKAENAPVLFLPQPRLAQLMTNNGPVPGHVTALRVGQETKVLFHPRDSNPAWHNFEQIQLGGN